MSGTDPVYLYSTTLQALKQADLNAVDIETLLNLHTQFTQWLHERQRARSKHRFLLPVEQSEGGFLNTLRELATATSAAAPSPPPTRAADLGLVGLRGMPPMKLPVLPSGLLPTECFVLVENHPEWRDGIYLSPVRNVYVRVAMAEVAYSKDQKDLVRTLGSIRCRYGTLDNCRSHVGARPCTFVHVGETFTRIGTASRCPTVPRIGAKDTLPSDLHALTPSDINTLLMHSVADLFLVMMWYRTNYTSKVFVFDAIDRCI